MPNGSTPPTQALSRTHVHSTSARTHGPDLLFSPAESYTSTPSIHLQSATDQDYDAILAMPQSGVTEDEYTLSAYGDISLGEVVVPPLPAPMQPIQPGSPQPRLRLKVRRPPMPKRRLSYAYIADPLGDVGLDERWPGSPKPFANSSPWVQHQPLVSPLPTDPKTSRTQGSKMGKNSGSSLEKLFDELIPHSPSIRLSPPGSPASQASNLPRETPEQKGGTGQGRNVPEADDATKVLHSPPTPAERRDKSKETPWRTRLPPRLPIPKWDM